MGHRVVQPTLEGPDLGEVVVSRGQFGVESDGLLEVANCFVPLALAFQGQPEVVVRRGEAAIDFEGLFVVVIGRLPVLFGRRAEAEIVVDGSHVLPKLQRPLVGGDRLVGGRAVLHHSGQGQGGPEIVGMLLMHSRQEGGPVPTEVM